MFGDKKEAADGKDKKSAGANVDDAAAEETLSLAEVVKSVKRRVPDLDDGGKQKLDKSGKPKWAELTIKADDVLSFKDYGSHIVVVTSDGQKHTNNEDA